MAETIPETKVETKPEGQTLLLAGKVNIVGESHNVSDPRRDLEKKFVEKMMGTGSGYWTETGFSAKQGEQDAGQGERAADPMELRAAQATAELIWRFNVLCELAERVELADGKPAVVKFLAEDVKGFRTLWTKLTNSWDPDQLSGSLKNPAVPAAVKSATDFFNESLGDFATNMESAWKQPAEDVLLMQIAAIHTLGSCSDKLPDLSQQLSAATGSDQVDPAALSDELNAKRSKSMVEEAASSGLAGVWKVGDEHIKDIMKASAADPTRVNVVSSDAFETAFKAWEKVQQ
jgi:hypothetical protein